MFQYICKTKVPLSVGLVRMDLNMKLLYGTGNPSKLGAMKSHFYDLPVDRLEELAVEEGFLLFFQRFLNLD